MQSTRGRETRHLESRGCCQENGRETHSEPNWTEKVVNLKGTHLVGKKRNCPERRDLCSKSRNLEGSERGGNGRMGYYSRDLKVWGLRSAEEGEPTERVPTWHGGQEHKW